MMGFRTVPSSYPPVPKGLRTVAHGWRKAPTVGKSQAHSENPERVPYPVKTGVAHTLFNDL